MKASPVRSQATAGSPSGYVEGWGNRSIPDGHCETPRVDGELLSVNVKEGDVVQQGQLLATIDPRPYEVQVQQAEGLVAQDQAPLEAARAELEQLQRQAKGGLIPSSEVETRKFEVARLQAKLMTDEAALNGAKLQLSYTRIHAPIGGVVGLRLLDAGNIVHASDTTGILVITQLQPAAVVFQIPEDYVALVRARVAEGAGVPVEVWNRDFTAKIGTGRLTAADNQIDLETGTLKLKAVLDNRNGALYPNQFVNVRLFLNSR